MAVVALLVSGCSISVPIGSLLGDGETTASTKPAAPVSPLSPDLGTEDWRRARAALAVALDPQGSGSAVSWDNPDTGMRGSFKPLGQPFVADDEICRSFLARVLGQGTSNEIQGRACRPSGGEWAVKTASP